jgi:hypothetical protein
MKILGLNYKFDYSKDNYSANVYGQLFHTTQTIVVANDLTKQHTESAILHEIIEALNYHLELGLEHRTIMSLESGLYQVLTDAGVDLAPLTSELSASVEEKQK